MKQPWQRRLATTSGDQSLDHSTTRLAERGFSFRSCHRIPDLNYLVTSQFLLNFSCASARVKSLRTMDANLFRQRAAALHVVPRQDENYRGGWPLGYIGPQCPADTPVVCKRSTDEEPQGCCPQGQFCMTTISEVYCCPTGKSPSVQFL